MDQIILRSMQAVFINLEKGDQTLAKEIKGIIRTNGRKNDLRVSSERKVPSKTNLSCRTRLGRPQGPERIYIYIYI
jgi:hypothetical protein